MRDRTKHRVEGVVEQDADELLMVATGSDDRMEEAQVIVDAPPGEIAKLIGVLLIGAEECLGVPAPMVAYEAAKCAEVYADESELMISQDFTGGGGDV